MGVANVNQRKKNRSTNTLMNPKQSLNEDGMKRKITLGLNENPIKNR